MLPCLQRFGFHKGGLPVALAKATAVRYCITAPARQEEVRLDLQDLKTTHVKREYTCQGSKIMQVMYQRLEATSDLMVLQPSET